MAITGQDIEQAKAILQQGGLVAIPTETVYGLGANALDAAAVAQIFQVKERPAFDPLIVHLPHKDHLIRYAKEIPTLAWRFAEAFWPGPVTMILPKHDLIPPLVTSGLNTVGLRVPRHPLTQQLLAALPFPLAAPSANPFGYISPTTARHVDVMLGHRIPYILDGGPATVGIESTIIGFENNQVVVYRLGGKSIEDFERVAGARRINLRLNSSSDPTAPGMLKSHYAPRLPLLAGKPAELLLQHQPQQVGVLAYTTPLPGIPADNQRVLSASGNPAEAAQNLFGAMRYLDGRPVKVILAEYLPETGLGKAINDRLRRAAANTIYNQETQ